MLGLIRKQQLQHQGETQQPELYMTENEWLQVYRETRREPSILNININVNNSIFEERTTNTGSELTDLQKFHKYYW